MQGINLNIMPVYVVPPSIAKIRHHQFHELPPIFSLTV
jgi:hypothetical protein